MTASVTSLGPPNPPHGLRFYVESDPSVHEITGDSARRFRLRDRDRLTPTRATSQRVQTSGRAYTSRFREDRLSKRIAAQTRSPRFGDHADDFAEGTSGIDRGNRRPHVAIGNGRYGGQAQVPPNAASAAWPMQSPPSFGGTRAASQRRSPKRSRTSSHSKRF